MGLQVHIKFQRNRPSRYRETALRLIHAMHGLTSNFLETDLESFFFAPLKTMYRNKILFRAYFTNDVDEWVLCSEWNKCIYPTSIACLRSLGYGVGVGSRSALAKLAGAGVGGSKRLCTSMCSQQDELSLLQAFAFSSRQRRGGVMQYPLEVWRRKLSVPEGIIFFAT